MGYLPVLGRNSETCLSLPLFERELPLCQRELSLFELFEGTVVGSASVCVATLTSIMGSKQHWVAVSDNARHYSNLETESGALWGAL